MGLIVRWVGVDIAVADNRVNFVSKVLHTLANWEASVCVVFDLSEIPSHSGLFLPPEWQSTAWFYIWNAKELSISKVVNCEKGDQYHPTQHNNTTQIPVLYAWQSPWWAKRCIDWQMFHGVLDRPKKDQAAINSACLLTFTRAHKYHFSVA